MKKKLKMKKTNTGNDLTTLQVSMILLFHLQMKKPKAPRYYVICSDTLLVRQQASPLSTDHVFFLSIKGRGREGEEGKDREGRQGETIFHLLLHNNKGLLGLQAKAKSQEPTWSLPQEQGRQGNPSIWLIICSLSEAHQKETEQVPSSRDLTREL